MKDIGTDGNVKEKITFFSNHIHQNLSILQRGLQKQSDILERIGNSLSIDSLLKIMLKATPRQDCAPIGVFTVTHEWRGCSINSRGSYDTQSMSCNLNISSLAIISILQAFKGNPRSGS